MKMVKSLHLSTISKRCLRKLLKINLSQGAATQLWEDQRLQEDSQMERTMMMAVTLLQSQEWIKERKRISRRGRNTILEKQLKMPRKRKSRLRMLLHSNHQLNRKVPSQRVCYPAESDQRQLSQRQRMTKTWRIRICRILRLERERHSSSRKKPSRTKWQELMRI